MHSWPRQPVIYEINAWTWLSRLSIRYRRRLTLGTVPAEEWDVLGGIGLDAVWLMGVWERSPESARIARNIPGLEVSYRNCLPDFSPDDVVGSPYAVHRYLVDEHLGGPDGLRIARARLAERGILLLLDFVPNHIARDHEWVTQHPEYFIQGSADDLVRDPGSYFRSGDRIIACGKDPFFPSWTDTAQINAFHPALRRAAIETLCDISSQCDGVRCDMAMLLLNQVFESTWKQSAGRLPQSEYWSEVIAEVRKERPGFLFLGEAYWDLEWRLQQQGFDYCYDKRLYDRLVHGDAQGIRLHLQADISYQEKLVRFIENHDEPRSAAVFPPAKLGAAALTALSLPGAKLLYEGQISGRRIRTPVQLGRCPEEKEDIRLREFYHRLLALVRSTQVRSAEWRLCEVQGWPDNSSYNNLTAWCLSGSDTRHVIVVNLSARQAQGLVRLPWRDLGGGIHQLEDLFTGESYRRDGNEMVNPGLYVGLEAWGFHFLKMDPVAPE